MKLRQAIIDAFRFLGRSREGFRRLQSLEEELERYLKLLLASGLLAALVSLLWSFGRALWLDQVEGVGIGYGRLLNYSLSLAAGTFFFYLFVGTFGLAILLLILAPLLRRRLAETAILLCRSLLPLLLFGWLSPQLIPGLLVWSLYLLILGIARGRAPPR